MATDFLGREGGRKIFVRSFADIMGIDLAASHNLVDRVSGR